MASFPFFIARRYLFSKKNTNAINIISGIAVSVFAIGTAVMIIILSFLNGLEGLVRELNDSFDPELKITASVGKTFYPDSLITELKKIDGIKTISATLEDNVVVRYGEAQEIARVKGVDEHFFDLNRMDTILVDGSLILELPDGKPGAIFGGVISNNLNISTNYPQYAATLYMPVKGTTYNSLNPDASLMMEYVVPTGIIMLTEEEDRDVIVVSLKTAQELLQTGKEVGAVELAVKPGYKVKSVQEEIRKMTKDKFLIRNRDEMNESAYRVFKTEKWATFAILTLVLMIAAFNVIGALTMLVLEKSSDIYIIAGMGADKFTIRRIFLMEGLLITALGIIIGGLIGIAFVMLQQRVGIVPIEGSFVEYFPIDLRWGDVVAVTVIIFVLGQIASLYPSWKATEKLNSKPGEI